MVCEIWVILNLWCTLCCEITCVIVVRFMWNVCRNKVWIWLDNYLLFCNFFFSLSCRAHETLPINFLSPRSRWCKDCLEWNFNSLHIFSCLLDSRVFYLFYFLSPFSCICYNFWFIRFSLPLPHIFGDIKTELLYHTKNRNDQYSF